MAQEKLLLVLISVFLTFTSSIAVAEEINSIAGVTAEDLAWANDESLKMKQYGLNEIKKQYYKLQKMLGRADDHDNLSSNNKLEDIDSRLLDDSIKLRIFVSISMGEGMLKRYVAQAKKYHAQLIFRGLPGGSWHKLSELVTNITGDDISQVEIQIDDDAFEAFDVKTVPTFVLSQERDMLSDTPPIFDKVSGAIGIRKALEIMSEDGTLADIAKNKLEQVADE